MQLVNPFVAHFRNAVAFYSLKVVALLAVTSGVVLVSAAD